MKIKINWSYVKGEPDTDEMEFLCLPARESKFEDDATLSFKLPDHNGNFAIAEIDTGDRDSSNLLCEEIVNRWNQHAQLLANQQNTTRCEYCDTAEGVEMMASTLDHYVIKDIFLLKTIPAPLLAIRWDDCNENGIFKLPINFCPKCGCDLRQKEE